MKSVHEDRLLAARKDQIGLAGQVLAVKPVAVAQPMHGEFVTRPEIWPVIPKNAYAYALLQYTSAPAQGG